MAAPPWTNYVQTTLSGNSNYPPPPRSPTGKTSPRHVQPPRDESGRLIKRKTQIAFHNFGREIIKMLGTWDLKSLEETTVA